MHKRAFSIPVAAVIAAVAALTGTATTAGAAGEYVTYVETVRCQSGVCEAQRKTVPLLEIVRQPDGPNFCLELTKRLTGFQTVPSLDPEVPIQIPQFEESKRSFRCNQDALARLVK